jgi:hypothetical protein
VNNDQHIKVNEIEKPADMSQEVSHYGENPLEHYAGLREAMIRAAEYFRDALTPIAQSIVDWCNTYFVTVYSDAPKRKHTGRLRSARELRDIRRQGYRVYIRDRAARKE